MRHSLSGSLIFNGCLQGISFLTDQGLLTGSSEDIYNFLLNNHVNGQKLGQYLGQIENLKVLELLIADFNFEGCSIDEALRLFLTDVVLPGDMDQMDQILTAFSEAHHRANSRNSTSADAVYALAFTVVLLSLSLHSPTSVLGRVTPEVIAFCETACPAADYDRCSAGIF